MCRMAEVEDEQDLTKCVRERRREWEEKGQQQVISISVKLQVLK